MSEKQNSVLRKFRVIYFSQSDHQGIDDTCIKSEIIWSYDEAGVKALFEFIHQKQIAMNKTFFGWFKEERNMEEKIRLGDHVCVSWVAEEYGGAYCGKTGVIERISNYRGKYGVALKGLHNDLSENELFWFSEESLFPQEEIDKEKMEKMVKARIELTNTFYNHFCKAFNFPPRQVEIKKVIFNNPATIVFWSDGKKTVVKCADDEAFDEEKGLAMAISKRVLGNQGNYYNEFKKWLPRIEVPCGRKNCDECDDLSLNKAMTGDARYECYSCRYLEVPLNKEPCENCNYHNSKYKPKKGAKINGRYL